MPQTGETFAPAAVDDDVVVGRDHKAPGRLRHLARHLNVGLRERTSR